MDKSPALPKLQVKHKLFVDTLFRMNFHKTRTYEKVYGKKPDTDYAYQLAYKILKRPEVIQYYDVKMKQYNEALSVTKNTLIERMMKYDNLYEEMIELASQDGALTEEESIRLSNLGMILTSKDAQRSRDMLIKLLGYYEADKTEITIRTEQPLFGPVNDDEDLDENNPELDEGGV